MKMYILDGHTPVEVDDPLTWGRWFETANRVVRKTETKAKYDGTPVGLIQVSTVFLGLDHNLSGSGEPVLFETMVFGGPSDGEMDRCSTWEGAEKMHEAMHEAMCLKVKIAVDDICN